jgi:hypothetical protein
VRLHQLNPIAKRVIHIESFVTLQGLVFDNAVTGLLQGHCKPTKVIDDKGRVCLPGRSELRVDTQVDFQLALLEPASASCSQMRRLGNFSYAKETLVEGSRFILVTCGHGKLDMIKSPNAQWHLQGEGVRD